MDLFVFPCPHELFSSYLSTSILQRQLFSSNFVDHILVEQSLFRTSVIGKGVKSIFAENDFFPIELYKKLITNKGTLPSPFSAFLLQAIWLTLL